MGKRFGRNQKRRMRAEMEKQNRVIEHWTETALVARHNFLRARRDLEELHAAAESLGHTALLHAQIYGVESPAYHPRYLLQHPSGASETVGLSFDIVERIDQGGGTFDLHAFLEGADGRWSYRVTEHTLRRAGLLPGPRREIMQRVVDELLLYIDCKVRVSASAGDRRHG